MEDHSIPGPSKKVRYGDPDFEETILKWAEEEYCSDFSEEDDGASDGEAILSEHDSESEIEVEENEDNDLSELDFVNPCDEENSNQNDTISRYYYGKNRFKWSSNPAFVRTTRTLQHNIVLKCPGLKNNIAVASDPLTAWKMLFTEK
ncbi:hypothetical protein QE152_g14030 [Popillia japonica]|uniref:Uncharacterized protein n=1 Tax=Popillia japonica TaxID=7064 RepID=A0AAW1L7S8_POPJA